MKHNNIILAVGFAISTVLAIVFIVLTINLSAENSKLNKIMDYACKVTTNTKRCKQGLEMIKSIDDFDKIEDIYGY